MSRRAALTEPARDDILDARRWYGNVHPLLAQDFVRSLRACVERIAAFPEAHPVVHRDLRKATLGRFPHAVFYRVEEARFVIVAVLHARRDPSVVTQRADE